jgi:hypothetical protein
MSGALNLTIRVFCIYLRYNFSDHYQRICDLANSNDPQKTKY